MYNKWNKHIGLTLLFVIICNLGYSQYSLSLQYLTGVMVPHSEFTKPLMANVNGIQIDALWKLRLDPSNKIASGSTIAYCPKIGTSLIFLNNGLSVTGYQLGAGVTFGAEISKKSEWLLSWYFTHGVSYLSEKYDTFTKPVNFAIGSHINFLAQLKVEAQYNILPNFSIGIGANLTHASNANFAKPNVGLNSIHANIGVVYFPNEIYNTERSSFYLHKKRYYTSPFSIGMRYAIREHTIEYPTSLSAVVTDIQYRIQKSANHIWDIGFDLFSDDNYKFDRYGNSNDISYQDQWELGLIFGHQYVFGRLGLRLDLGMYLFRPIISEKPAFYNCVGIDYRLSQNWVARTRLKAHLNVADYMEFGLSYLW